jgi:hypothetical protein
MHMLSTGFHQAKWLRALGLAILLLFQCCFHPRFRLPFSLYRDSGTP